jgi:glycosyltransferase involved in cell wall biosynthesis
MVISPPCHQPVNRAVYHELAERHGIPVHLVVPRRLYVGNQWRDTPQGAPAPYELTMLDLTGTHGRLQRLSGLDAVAAQWQPTHVLVDNDPATLMTWQAARTCPQAKLWALTAENLTPHYLRDFWAGLKAKHPARMIGPLMVWALRLLVHPQMDRVFTLSNDGTRVMETMGCSATQIPLGFDPALFCIQPSEKIAATRARLGLTQPTLAYFGRLTPEKGLHLLLHALASIKNEPWQFLVDHFSDYQTDYTRELQAKIEALGLADRVVYFDAKHDEMPDFMNAADIVVLPSLSTPKWKEQYGRVLPEAMACGKVVIGSDSGAIPELVCGFGHIVPEGDVPALAAKLRELLHRTDLKAEGERAATYSHDHLSITRQAKIWADLLRA